MSLVAAECVLAEEVEIRFERQPVDVARFVMGLAFERIDEAVIHAASQVAPGESFAAAVPGWDIFGERCRERLIKVVRIVPSRGRVKGSIAGYAGSRDSRLAS
jgi:hypothetical protein